MNTVLFTNHQSDYSIDPKWIKKIEDLVQNILQEHDYPNYTLNVVFCDNDFIKKFNRQYRNKENPTDVLSFPTLENLDGEEFDLLDKNLGDILISTDKVKEQAREYQVPENEELARLLIHGVLHLIGYDHERSAEDEKEMFDLQDRYLESLKNL